MKKCVRFCLLIMLLFTTLVARADQSATQVITFLEPGEMIPNDAQKIMTIVMTGNNPARGCAEYELKQDAHDTAIAIGANLVREDGKRGRSQDLPCDEVTFSFYKVADIHAAEKRFSWSAARPLTWIDFKGGVPENAANSTAAETSCGIAIETNTVTATNPPKIYVINTFQTFTSWVRPGFARADILEHEQGHWNICELYTRKMRSRFAAASMDVRNLRAIVSKIYMETMREYSARQELYERETQHGVVSDEQAKWTAAINKELAETATF